MPRVPVYGGPQVRTEALPGVRQTAALTEEAAGVGTERARAQRSAAIGELGSTVGQIGGALYTEIQRKAVERAEEVAATTAENGLGMWQVKRLHDPETGALNVRGRNAMGQPEQVMAEFDQVAAEMENNLTTPRQKAIFRKIKERRGLNILEVLSDHTSREITRVETEELQTKIENTNALVSANANNPRVVAEEIDVTAAAIRTHGAKLGWDLDTIESKIADVESSAFTAAVTTLIDNGQTKPAKIYFESIASRITDPKDRERLSKMLTQQTDLQDGLTLADQILDEGGTEDEQLRKARERSADKPQIREHVERRIAQEASRRKVAEREHTEDTLDEAYRRVDGGASVDSLPESMKHDLGRHISSVREYEDRRARKEPTESDLGIYYDMMQAAVGNPKNFAELNLRPLQSKLSPGDYKRLIDHQMDLRAGNAKAAEKTVAEYQGKKDVFDTTLRTWGINPDIDPKDKTGPAAQALAVLQHQVEIEVNYRQERTNKPVTADEQREIINNILTQEHGRKGSFFGGILYGWSGVPLTDSSKRLIDISYEDIPSAARADLEATMRRHGRPVSPATVRDRYIKQLLYERSLEQAKR